MSASLLARPLLIKRTLRLTQPLLPALAGRDLRRKLIAARLAVELILGPVGRDRLLDDLPCDPLAIKRRVAAGVGVDLGAVDRDDCTTDQASRRAQPEHRAEHVRQRPLVALDEPRD